jgi:hypothetical protein
MKKLFGILLIIPMLFFCSFTRKEKPYIVLSSGMITSSTLQRVERCFTQRQRINFAIVAPDGFKTPGVRMQISKKDEKVSNWGFSIVQTRDIFLDMAQKTYTDYIYLQNPGYYVLQFFYLNNKDYPFAHAEFLVR